MIEITANGTWYLGFGSAILLTLLGLAYLTTLVVSFDKAKLSFPPPASIQLAGAIISIFTALSLIFLMVALRWQVSEAKKPFVELAIVFMALLCAMTSANRIVQLSMVPKYTQPKNPQILQLIHPYGSESIMFTFESLGWGLFYGLGALCVAFAFQSSGLELWISWLFIVGGLLSLLYMIGFVIRHPILSMLGFPAWSVLLTITSALIAVWFWQML